MITYTCSFLLFLSPQISVSLILRSSKFPLEWTQSFDYGYVPSPQRHLGRTGYPPQIKSREYLDRGPYGLLQYTFVNRRFLNILLRS